MSSIRSGRCSGDVTRQIWSVYLIKEKESRANINIIQNIIYIYIYIFETIKIFNQQIKISPPYYI
ncbi:hypothetical protein M5K25_012535 [Dendrobium thyrsiflorum]|uniref:Uncharacterized protein n=1 Tax=Dendrobium thyrsiflorum TaxID=117978 RepID=A0ABD0V451_DENTH